MPYSCLDVRREGPVEHVELARPAVRNAFNAELVAELTAWAEEAARQPDLRAAVISGSGKVFSAGADLAWMAQAAEYSREENLQDATSLGHLFEALDHLPCPLVGRIHGAALGGGTGLVAVCDIAVAADDTIFGFTEVRLGVVPAVISPYVLAKIGVSAARELFLTGTRFTATRACQIGLVHRAVPASELAASTAAVIADILSAGPEAVAAAKVLIARVAGRSPAEVLPVTAATIADRRASDEGRAGMRAFLEKRHPPWTS